MTITENTIRAGSFLISEAPGHRSREQITVLSGDNLKAGHVVGRKVTAATAAATAKSGNTGSGSIGTVTPGAEAQVGRYTLTIIEPGSNAGVFEVQAPDGQEVTGTVAVAFSALGLGFTLADATDFISGDQIYIDVSAATYKYREYNPANTDGTEVPVGVLWDAVDASSADKHGVVIRHSAEVNKDKLVWFSGATSLQKSNALVVLAKREIIGRASA